MVPDGRTTTGTGRHSCRTSSHERHAAFLERSEPLNRSRNHNYLSMWPIFSAEDGPHAFAPSRSLVAQVHIGLVIHHKLFDPAHQRFRRVRFEFDGAVLILPGINSRPRL